MNKYYLSHTIISRHLLQIDFGVHVLYNDTQFRKEIYSIAHSTCLKKKAFPLFTDFGPHCSVWSSLSDLVSVTEMNRRKGTHHILVALYSNEKI